MNALTSTNCYVYTYTCESKIGWKLEGNVITRNESSLGRDKKRSSSYAISSRTKCTKYTWCMHNFSRHMYRLLRASLHVFLLPFPTSYSMNRQKEKVKTWNVLEPRLPKFFAKTLWTCLLNCLFQPRVSLWHRVQSLKEFINGLGVLRN